jgi:uncharacterized protein YjbI with pentapeptide repeats
MDLREAIRKYKQLKVPSLSEIQEKASQHSKTSLFIIIFLFALLLLALQYIPHYQVAQFNITNQKDLADAENSYRATLAQIFGGVAIAISIYYTWRRITIAEEDLKATQKNLEVIQEGQITERFTRAIDQLGAVDKDGNPAIEIRLGGIYALERIANESEKDYWPIMEILTAYVRKNSNIKEFINCKDRISIDIQTILNILKKRKYSFENGEFESLDLRKTFLQGANIRGTNLRKAFLQETNLKNANFSEANLEEACLSHTNCIEASFAKANLKGTFFIKAILQKTNFDESDLKGAYFSNANLKEAVFGDSILQYVIFEDNSLEEAYFGWANVADAIFNRVNLQGAIFKGANLSRTIFQEADFMGADLMEVNFYETDLKGAKNLTVDQLSKVKTLYKAQLDPELEAELRTKGFGKLIDEEPK